MRCMLVFFHISVRSCSLKSVCAGLLTPPKDSLPGASPYCTSSSTNRPQSISQRSFSRFQSSPVTFGCSVAPCCGHQLLSHFSSRAFTLMSTLSQVSLAQSV